MKKETVYSWKTLKKNKFFFTLTIVLLSYIGLTYTVIPKTVEFTKEFNLVHFYLQNNTDPTYLEEKGLKIIEVEVQFGETFTSIQKEFEGTIAYDRSSAFMELNKKTDIDNIIANKKYFFVVDEKNIENFSDLSRVSIIDSAKLQKIVQR